MAGRQHGAQSGYDCVKAGVLCAHATAKATACWAHWMLHPHQVKTALPAVMRLTPTWKDAGSRRARLSTVLRTERMPAPAPRYTATWQRCGGLGVRPDSRLAAFELVDIAWRAVLGLQHSKHG